MREANRIQQALRRSQMTEEERNAERELNNLQHVEQRALRSQDEIEAGREDNRSQQELARARREPQELAAIREAGRLAARERRAQLAREAENVVRDLRDVQNFNEEEHNLGTSFVGNLRPDQEGNYGNQCQFCGALLFTRETSQLCCHQGTTKIPLLDPPEEIRQLFTNSKFIKKARKFNNAVAMASLGMDQGEVAPPDDGQQFKGMVKVQGKIYHQIGNINPPGGQRPCYLQLYFIDDVEALDCRRDMMNRGNAVLTEEEDEMLRTIMEVMHRDNPFVKDLKTAKELIEEQAQELGVVAEGNIVITNDRRLIPANAHQRSYNLAESSEVGGILLGDRDVTKSKDGPIRFSDLVLKLREHSQLRLDKISTCHRSYDSLMYVLFHIRGEDGWTRWLERSARGKYKGGKLTERDFYAYRLQVRPNDFNLPLRGGRLTQMYMVDMWAKVEAHILEWARNNQNQLRAEQVNVLLDALNSEDYAPDMQRGNRVILPSSHLGSPRYWKECFQNAMAIVREFGCPDYFITMTCNPKWPEIVESLMPGQQAVDRPDIIERVFKLKHEEMKRDDILGGNEVFGKVVAYTESIEFQKRGLPHCHMLIWVRPVDKPVTAKVVDSTVSAEIPDKRTNPKLYDLVMKNMIHGPCAPAWNPMSPCLEKKGDGPKECNKGFPKEFRNTTLLGDDSYPQMRRRSPEDGGHFHTITKFNGDAVTIDNSYVVAHNPALLLKYQCHMNVEVVHTVLCIKYIFKYICKGQDRINVKVPVEVQPVQGGVQGAQEPQEQPNAEAELFPHTQQVGGLPEPDAQFAVGGYLAQHRNMKDIDEITEYQDARYISASEAVWRLFQFCLHNSYPPVEKLPIHMPGQERFLFDDDQPLDRARVEEFAERKDRLTGFFHLCEQDPEAREYTYLEIIKRYRWIAKTREVPAHWAKRKRGKRDEDGEVVVDNVARIPQVPMARFELYHMRLLLYHVKGPTSYKDLRTFEEIEHPTYRKACMARGLIPNDEALKEAMYEIKDTCFGKHMRTLFCILLTYHTPADALALWQDQELQHAMCEDFRRRDKSPFVRPFHVNAALAEIEDILTGMGRSLQRFNLPVPDREELGNREHLAVREEMIYDVVQLQQEVNNKIDTLNEEQRTVFDTVMASVEEDEGKVFCLNAGGGTGKTYTLNMILDAVRGKNMVALATATSGIAATLLHSGRTVHSRFKVPIEITEESMCNMDEGTKQLCERTKLIIIDEAIMGNKLMFRVCGPQPQGHHESIGPGAREQAIWRHHCPLCRRLEADPARHPQGQGGADCGCLPPQELHLGTSPDPHFGHQHEGSTRRGSGPGICGYA